MIAATRLIQSNACPALADEMALALRNLGSLADEDARFAAYYRANLDLFRWTFKEQRAADKVAVSIEMTRRMAGFQ